MYEVLLEALQEGNYSFSMILGKQVYDNDKSYSIPSAYTKKHSYTRNNDKKFIQPYPPTARNKKKFKRK